MQQLVVLIEGAGVASLLQSGPCIRNVEIRGVGLAEHEEQIRVVLEPVLECETLKDGAFRIVVFEARLCCRERLIDPLEIQLIGEFLDLSLKFPCAAKLPRFQKNRVGSAESFLDRMALGEE